VRDRKSAEPGLGDVAVREARGQMAQRAVSARPGYMTPKGQYFATATIRAAPGLVWTILSDAAGYSAWNPEVIMIDGRLAAGETFKAHVKLGDGAVRRVRMRVTEFEPPRLMTWIGGLPLGLFVGHRKFTLAAGGTGTDFQMELSMTGPLAALILKSVGDRQPEIDRFAAALKTYAERSRSA